MMVDEDYLIVPPPRAVFYQPQGWAVLFVEALEPGVPRVLPEDHQDVLGAQAIRNRARSRGLKARVYKLRVDETGNLNDEAEPRWWALLE